MNQTEVWFKTLSTIEQVNTFVFMNKEILTFIAAYSETKLSSPIPFVFI